MPQNYRLPSLGASMFLHAYYLTHFTNRINSRHALLFQLNEGEVCNTIFAVWIGQPTWFLMTPHVHQCMPTTRLTGIYLLIFHFFFYVVVVFSVYLVSNLSSYFNFSFFFFLLISVLLAWLLLFGVRFYPLAISLKTGGVVLRRWRQKDWRRKALIIDLFFFLFFFSFASSLQFFL